MNTLTVTNKVVVPNEVFGDLTVINGEQGMFFIGKEVATMLGYSNTAKAVAAHCKKTQILTSQNGTFELNIPNRGLTIIPESDVYRLIIKSTLPLAEAFEEWVMEEVLPEIRKTGRYSTQQAIPDFSNPAAAARAWADEVEAKMLAIATKAEIGSRREATSMATASVQTKRANKLELELDKSKEYYTIKRVSMLNHGQPYNWRHLKSAGKDLGIEPEDVFDQNYGTVKAYHKDVWKEAYGLELN